MTASEACVTTVSFSRYLFTGKERDSESGNDYFGARYYASSMGLFMSPDWSAKAKPVPYAKLDNPQSLNLYTYVGNNPLSRADADGHFWQELKNWATGNGWQTNAQIAANNASVRTEIVSAEAIPNSDQQMRQNIQQQGYSDCIANSNASLGGKAINFGSPLALVPGWNPDATETIKDWAEAIGTKGGVSFGTGALGTPEELTTLVNNGKNDISIASPLEKGVEKVESGGPIAMSAATVADVAVHGSCFAGATMQSIFTPPSNSVNMNGVTVQMPDESDPHTWGAP